MMTGKDESILMSIPMLDSIFPQLTNQQFINCAFLERPPSRIPSTVLPYSADPSDRRFSKSQDERLACWCVYGILQATVNQNGER